MNDNVLDNVPRDVLEEIVCRIDAYGVEELYDRFEHAESVQIPTNKSVTWITVGSQSDSGFDGGWGSAARIEIELDNDLAEYEITAASPAGNIVASERFVFDELIDVLRDCLCA